MSTPRLHEPDLFASAVQATVLMSALILPLALSIDLKRTIIPVSLSVPVVTEARPAPAPQPAEGISELREQVKQRQQQTEADLARRRQQAEEEERQRRQEEEERRRQQEEEDERQRRLAEEEERQLQAEQQERERRRQMEQRQQAEREAAERRRAEAAAGRLTAEQRASLIGRYTTGIRERVHRYMSNPEGIGASDDIAVEVRVRLDSRGMLAAAPVIERSSGSSAYDNQAIRAVIRAADGGFELPDDPQLRTEFGDLLLTIRPKQQAGL